MNYNSDYKRSGSHSDYESSSHRADSHSAYSTASRKWPQEARKIVDEMERRKTVVQERLTQPSKMASGRKKGLITAVVMVGAIFLIGWGMKTAGELFSGAPDRDPRLKAIQERSQDVEAFAKAHSEIESPVEKRTIPSKDNSPEPPKAEKMVSALPKADTLWLPSPNLPDSIALKKLRTRIVLDPAHKGAPITWISKDSVWLLMRVNADSARIYRNARAYIDLTGNLVIR